jgi:hypothetical protein
MSPQGLRSAFAVRALQDRDPMTQRTRQDNRSLRIGIGEGLLYALLPMLIAMATGIRTLPGVIAGGLLNPDSYMRIVRLEAALQHHEFGYIVARDGSGTGTLLHWSHLVDFLLVLLAAPLHLVLDSHAALHAAAAAFGPLSMAALGVALAWAAAPLAERRWLWLAPSAVALSPTIVSYGLPGVTHHHVLLVLCAVMTGGYALRGALALTGPRAGLAMGAWAGVGIWMSPESMPLSLMAFGGLWLAWLTMPERRDLAPMIRITGVGFLAVVTAGFAVDPPYAGYASVEIDRISVVYLVLAFAVCMMGCAAAALDRLQLRGTWRIASGLVIPILYLTVWLGLFPTVVLGPAGLMSAQETRAFLGGITEMMPVRHISEAVEFLMTGVLTTIVLAWLGVSRRSLLLGYVTLCACALLVLGAMHIRFAAYATAAAAVMLPMLITRCTSYLAAWPEAAQAGARVGLMALFVLLPRAEGLPGVSSSASAATNETAPTCSLSNLDAMLASHAGQVVLADPSDAPELLYRTRVLTVGSLYHRNVAAFMRLRDAWRSGPSDSVPQAVRQTGASLVLACHGAARSLLVADLPQQTLLDRLNHGDVPPWLHKLDQDPQSGNALYEVVQ